MARAVKALEAVPDGDVVDGLIEAWVDAQAVHGDAARLLARLGRAGAESEALAGRRAALADATLSALARAERVDVLLNGSARYSARLLAEVVGPLLDVYGAHPGGTALFRDALRAMLVKRRGQPAGAGRRAESPPRRES